MNVIVEENKKDFEVETVINYSEKGKVLFLRWIMSLNPPVGRIRQRVLGNEMDVEEGQRSSCVVNVPFAGH